MTLLRSLPVLFASLLLAACGGGSDNVVADDGGGSSPMPTEIPAAAGTVHTRDLAVVMDTGQPELCLGPVAESYPPQCGGPRLIGWDWADQQGIFETEGSTRWGSFAVSGTFDGAEFTVTAATPAALYDTVAQSPSPEPEGTDTDAATLARIQKETEQLPGLLSAATYDGYVGVEVVHDDGSLQAWADETYGEGVVVITSALVEAR